MLLIKNASHFYSDFAALIRTVNHHVRGAALSALFYLTVSSLVDGFSVAAIFPVLKLLLTAGHASIEVIPDTRIFGQHFSLRMTLEMLLVSLVCLVALRAWLIRQRDVSSSLYSISLMTDLRGKLFDAISNVRWEFIQTKRLSDIQNVLTVEIVRAQITAIHALTLAQATITLIIFLGISFFVSPAITLMAALCGFVALACLSPVRRRAHRYGQGLGIRNEAQARIIGDFLNGLKVAKSINAESVFRDRFNGSLKSNRVAFSNYSRARADGTASLQVASAILATLFLYVSFRYLHTPLTKTAAILIIFSRVVPRFTSVQMSAQEIMTNISAFSTYDRLVHECEGAVEPTYVSAQIPEFQNSIALEDVTFGHRSRAGAHALKNVSLRMPVGTVTALIGPSGSGKSTIADILMGLLTPSAGSIQLDERKLDEAELHDWREQVGYVPQEGLLLNDTILENLTLGLSRQIEETEVWAALTKANAESLVRGLPQGLQTEVGERGTLLSGGERQRIVLARALLRHPRLLILDEATSALDWENQELIAKSIANLKGETTVLTIAHRLSMIAFADQVVAIKDGRIVESGSFSDLAAAPDSHLARVIEGETAEKR